jgi:DNA-binding LytR/AlgR family response regulator
MNIAVIEDEKYSREELIHQILDVLPDARILQAGSGVEGLELIEKEAFDLLFIDVRLGDMLGITVASLARKLQPNAKVVFATAYSEYGVKAFELGVHNYILKPFDPNRVRQVLNELMSSYHPPGAVSFVPVQKMAVTVNRHTTPDRRR